MLFTTGFFCFLFFVVLVGGWGGDSYWLWELDWGIKAGINQAKLRLLVSKHSLWLDLKYVQIHINKVVPTIGLRTGPAIELVTWMVQVQPGLTCGLHDLTMVHSK